jgi:S-adenosylmethionine hydrolase
MSIIVLTTDFGQRDGYVGIMKGVILGIAPASRFVDLSHEVPPQNIAQAAYILQHAIPYFPVESIHLVVVDPGVGSERRPLLVRARQCWFVGPDNGVLTPALDDAAAQVWELTERHFWLASTSATFHGRDIFAPCAAHIANGASSDQLGRRIADPVRLVQPEPAREQDGRLRGQVVYVDRFGNLITNVPAEWLHVRDGIGRWRCIIAGREVSGPQSSYAAVRKGELVALISSSETLEIGVRDGNAAATLEVNPGEPVTLYPG